MTEINLRAMAKINLGLDVLRRREDGYHEVRMVMQSVSLFDRIFLRTTEDGEIKVKTNLYYLPANENNLVYKAAKLLKDEFGIREGLRIDLKKFIPVSAGMAGGSSDAAAVLYGMNQLFGLRLSWEELKKRGVKIGADVPFCLIRGTALAEGIGEKLTSLPPAPDCLALLAKPPISVSTKFVYENLRLDKETVHPDIDGICQAIRESDLPAMAAKMGNVLETVTCKQYPVIVQLKELMKAHGALNAMMSGSGPTVFGLFTEKEAAEAAREAIREQGLAKQVYLTELFQSKISRGRRPEQAE